MRLDRCKTTLRNPLACVGYACPAGPGLGPAAKAPQARTRLRLPTQARLVAVPPDRAGRVLQLALHAAKPRRTSAPPSAHHRRYAANPLRNPPSPDCWPGPLNAAGLRRAKARRVASADFSGFGRPLQKQSGCAGDARSNPATVPAPRLRIRTRIRNPAAPEPRAHRGRCQLASLDCTRPAWVNRKRFNITAHYPK